MNSHPGRPVPAAIGRRDLLRAAIATAAGIVLGGCARSDNRT